MRPTSLLAVLSCLGLASCFSWFLPREPPLPTIDGPEDPDLGAATGASLASARRNGRIELVRLSDGSRHTIPSGPHVIELSGPDADGRVAWLLHPHRGHNLRIGRPDSGAEPLSPFAARPTFSVGAIALAPSGGSLAYWAQEKWGRSSDSAPPVRLEILEIETGAVRTTEIVAHGPASWPKLAWFPDSRRLLVDQGEQEFRIFDASTGALSEAVARGDRVWIAPEGTSLIVHGHFGGPLRRVDLDTGTEVPWNPPPGVEYPMGFPAPGLLVAIALPTTGDEQVYCHGPICRSHPKPTVKVFDLGSGAFLTLDREVHFEILYSTGSTSPP